MCYKQIILLAADFGQNFFVNFFNNIHIIGFKEFFCRKIIFKSNECEKNCRKNKHKTKTAEQNTLFNVRFKLCSWNINIAPVPEYAQFFSPRRTILFLPSLTTSLYITLYHITRQKLLTFYI